MTDQEQQLISNLHSEFASLAHKHATVSYAVLGILLVVLGMAGLGGFLGLRAYNEQLAKADAKQAQYEQAAAEWRTQLKQSEDARVQDAKKVQTATKTIVIRDAQANTAIQEAVKPGQTAETVRDGLQRAYSDVQGFGDLPPVEGDKVVTTAQQSQQIIAYKLDRDRLSANLTDEKVIVDLQIGTISSLNNDLTQCKAQVGKAEDQIKTFQKLAHRSRFRRFLDGAIKYGGPIAGFALGVSMHR